MKNIFLSILIICLCFLNCSNDDDSCPISGTEIYMTIDGTNYVFYNGGRGIDLTENGNYDLRLWINYYNVETDLSYQIIVKLFLYETGENVIDSFYFIKSQNSDYVEEDFVDSNFSDRVTTNSKGCFASEFSGELILNDQESIIITNGKLNVVYEDPFD